MSTTAENQYNSAIKKQLRSYYIDNENPENRSTLYYDRAFMNIIENKRPQPNWAAALLQGIWAIYRGEYILAFVISLISQTVGTLEILYPQWLTGSSLFVSITLFFTLAFQANILYFKSIIRKIKSGIQRNQAGQNTDFPAMLATVAFAIVMTSVAVLISVAQLRAAQFGEIANVSIISVEKYLTLNWLVFISFWLCIYLCRIMPFKKETE